MLPSLYNATLIRGLDSGSLFSYKHCFERLSKIVFDSLYYRDVGLNINEYFNSLDDGYLGWSNASSSMITTSNFIIRPNIEKAAWLNVVVNCQQHTHADSITTVVISVKVTDSSGLTTAYCDSAICDDGFRSGTISFLSAWSDTMFRNISISRILPDEREIEIYTSSSDSSFSLFRNNWKPVICPNDPSFTANISADEWQMDTNGIISCYAASNAPTGIPRASRAFGKYAALVFDNSSVGLQPNDLSNAIVRFSMRINRRNIATAESGLAIRWHADSMKDHLSGELKKDRYQYFIPHAKYYGIKLRPKNILQVVKHSNTWWYGPWDEDGTSALNGRGYPNDGLTYDFQICGTISQYIRKYPGELDSILLYNTESDSGVISKWKSVWDRDTKTWNYGYNGNGGYLSFGGWRIGYIWTSYFGRFAQHLLNMIHVPSCRYHCFYRDNFRDICDSLLSSEFWIDQDRRSFQWKTQRDFIGEMEGSNTNNTTSADYAGPLVAMLIDAHADSLISGIHFEHLSRLSRTFSISMWNQKTGTGSFISRFINGLGDTTVVLSDWAKLSKYDFIVWEILDDYLSATDYRWSEYASTTGYKSIYGLISAEMTRCASNGTPRNLRIDTVKTPFNSHEEEQYWFILNWEPPSSYPIGYCDEFNVVHAGTRMKYYNVYRRRLERIVDEDSVWTPWESYDAQNRGKRFQISIHEWLPQYRNTWQKSFHAPFFIDTTYIPGFTYQYRLTAQDWSKGINNESAPTNIVTVSYPVLKKRLQLFPVNALAVNQEISIKSGAFYLPFDLTLSLGSLLRLSNETKLYFARDCKILGSGSIVYK